jgi:mannose-1-phosphate guanylyltransferase
MLHAVIMAGGSGTRLWPESRAARPKQLLAVEGDRTMLQATVDRLGALVSLERILIATRQDLAGEVQSQLSHLPRGAILAEPCPRNTAPCIGLAAIRIVRDDPEGLMLVLPADQIIAPAEVFRDAVRLAAALVEETPDRLITFGIRPTYPATGFGYIERGLPLPSFSAVVHRVARFHEKPTREVAEEYVAAGRFSWNSGIFVWRAQTILDALARHRPPLYAGLMRIADAAGHAQFQEVVGHEFAAMEKVSIDYAVMEQAEEVAVIEAAFQWDDVGGWLALERYRPHDDHGNVTDAARHLAINSGGNVIRAHDPNHVVVVAGVNDLVVVVTPDATLVANKHDEKSLAQITEELRKRGWTEYL